MKTYIKVENDKITAITQAGSFAIPVGEESLWEETTDVVDVGYIRDGSGWSDIENLWEDVRNERDRLIGNVLWRVQRHEQQIALGETPSEDNATYLALLQYIQDLRDVPQSQSDPENITWPNMP